MREIKQGSAFKKDILRESKGKNLNVLNDTLPNILSALASDIALSASHRDHKLTGKWEGYRECHIKPDLLLIYQTIEADILRLVRLGSHSELFR